MDHYHHSSGGQPNPTEERAANAERAAFHDALAHRFSEAGMYRQKIEWCLSEVSSITRTLSRMQLKNLSEALCAGEGWSATPQRRSVLVESPPLLAEISSAVVSALTRESIGQTGLHNNVMRHVEKGRHLVFISNNRHITDTAIVAHLLGRTLPDRLVEFSCHDSFPDPFTRAILQGGRTLVRTSDTVLDTVARPFKDLSGSPWENLFEAIRMGKWPILFPEALDCHLMKEWEAERKRLIMAGEGWLIPEAHPFKTGAIAPFMNDIPETLGIDPARVVFIPLKVLYSGNVWYRYDICEEMDTIVKFGRGIPLPFLRKEFGQREDRASHREAAEFVRDRVLSLGSSYQD